MSELRLLESKHPNEHAKRQFASLVGIDANKQLLVDELSIVLGREKFKAWASKHHPRGLTLVDSVADVSPLMLLSGDVGCGKTALAGCVATIVAEVIDRRILVLETPSDIRGGGHVGEVSSRITETFAQAKAKIGQIGAGILIIDEADDLATSRSQMQAHHEDRAGVNVLIKQIDQLRNAPAPLAVIMITNRLAALDPAVQRRAALSLEFSRPDKEARAAAFRSVLAGAAFDEADIRSLVAASEASPGYTYSDLITRVAKTALRRAWKRDLPLSVKLLKEALTEVRPSPQIGIPVRA